MNDTFGKVFLMTLLGIIAVMTIIFIIIFAFEVLAFAINHFGSFLLVLLGLFGCYRLGKFIADIVEKDLEG